MTLLPFDLPRSWAEVLKDELKKSYLVRLKAFLAQEQFLGHIVYPSEKNIFRALELTSFDNVKVVLVGQDPYHGPGQAHGLSFSVPQGIRPPPSLQNIFKELLSDLGIPVPSTGCLEPWAKQGVLLLNATLTVREAEPLSHHKKGWEEFTDAIIQRIAERKKHVVFMLWGKNAQEKCERFSHLLKDNHLVLTAAHPSPYSANNGFFGCKHFSQANAYLVAHGLEPIQWSV
jgi:uracil-DNA glycosylase